MWRGCRAHLLPGRMRVWLPALLRRPDRCAAAVAKVRALAGVRSVAANPITGSLLIAYDPWALQRDAIGDALGLSGVSVQQQRQSPQMPVVTGGALAFVLVKRFLLGPSAAAGSMLTWDLAGLITVAAGYPLLRRGVEGRLPRADTLLAGAGLVAALVRENVPGLLVLFTHSLHHQISAQEAHGPAVAKGWGAVGLAAGLGAAAVSGNWRRGLATLVAGAPAAAAFAASLPRALAAGRGARAAAQAERIAWQNRRLAALLHGAGLGLAAAGSLTPTGASLWHNVTSLAVMGNASRVLRAV